uniref:Transmembrane protein n=1 Tax=Citrus limon TaxID=2708 RepID=A0A1S8ADI7_CITLI
MTAGPAGTKVLRLLYFVGAGFICTATITKWWELERKSLQKKQQESDLWTDDNSATTVQKAVK